jgi:hypothetical protein
MINKRIDIEVKTEIVRQKFENSQKKYMMPETKTIARQTSPKWFTL